MKTVLHELLETGRFIYPNFYMNTMSLCHDFSKRKLELKISFRMFCRELTYCLMRCLPFLFEREILGCRIWRILATYLADFYLQDEQVSPSHSNSFLSRV